MHTNHAVVGDIGWLRLQTLQLSKNTRSDLNSKIILGIRYRYL